MKKSLKCKMEELRVSVLDASKFVASYNETFIDKVLATESIKDVELLLIEFITKAREYVEPIEDLEDDLVVRMTKKEWDGKNKVLSEFYSIKHLAESIFEQRYAKEYGQCKICLILLHPNELYMKRNETVYFIY